jgi:hypothetical protein
LLPQEGNLQKVIPAYKEHNWKALARLDGATGKITQLF